MRLTGFDRFVEVKGQDLGCCGKRTSEMGLRSEEAGADDAVGGFTVCFGGSHSRRLVSSVRKAVQTGQEFGYASVFKPVR